MALLHDGASRKRAIGMASAAPQYDRPSLGKTVRLANIPALGTRKPLPPPQVLKVYRACRVIGEYPLKFGERRRETTGIHGRNLAPGYLIGNKPDRQATNNATQVTLTDLAPLDAQLLSVTPSQGSCAKSPISICRLGALALNKVATIKLKLKATLKGKLTNQASVNAEELDHRFLESLKAQFEHKEIEITVREAEQNTLDETAYLLNSPVNRERLLKAIANAERGEHLVTIDVNELQ
jgi:hypothetical protein